MSTPPATWYDLVTVLSRHVSRERGVGVRELARDLDCPERRVRELVTRARAEGVAICGHPRTGYYVASEPADIEHTCRFLRARAMRSLALEARLRRIPLPDLLGQLKLPT